MVNYYNKHAYFMQAYDISRRRILAFCAGMIDQSFTHIGEPD
jgi:hypothetical protein